MSVSGNLQLLSFVSKINGKAGLSYYPSIGQGGSAEGEQKGKENAVELIEFCRKFGFHREVLSKILISMVGIDPVNDDLSMEEQTMIGHIKGMASVIHHYVELGVAGIENNKGLQSPCL